jgi:hypothetical protein
MTLAVPHTHRTKCPSRQSMTALPSSKGSKRHTLHAKGCHHRGLRTDNTIHSAVSQRPFLFVAGTRLQTPLPPTEDLAGGQAGTEGTAAQTGNIRAHKYITLVDGSSGQVPAAARKAKPSISSARMYWRGRQTPQEEQQQATSGSQEPLTCPAAQPLLFLVFPIHPKCEPLAADVVVCNQGAVLPQ